MIRILIGIEKKDGRVIVTWDGENWPEQEGRKRGESTLRWSLVENNKVRIHQWNTSSTIEISDPLVLPEGLFLISRVLGQPLTVENYARNASLSEIRDVVTHLGFPNLPIVETIGKSTVKISGSGRRRRLDAVHINSVSTSESVTNDILSALDVRPISKDELVRILASSAGANRWFFENYTVDPRPRNDHNNDTYPLASFQVTAKNVADSERSWSIVHYGPHGLYLDNLEGTASVGATLIWLTKLYSIEDFLRVDTEEIEKECSLAMTDESEALTAATRFILRHWWVLQILREGKQEPFFLFFRKDDKTTPWQTLENEFRSLSSLIFDSSEQFGGPQKIGTVEKLHKKHGAKLLTCLGGALPGGNTFSAVQLWERFGAISLEGDSFFGIRCSGQRVRIGEKREFVKLTLQGLFFPRFESLEEVLIVGALSEGGQVLAVAEGSKEVWVRVPQKSPDSFCQETTKTVVLLVRGEESAQVTPVWVTVSRSEDDAVEWPKVSVIRDHPRGYLVIGLPGSERFNDRVIGLKIVA